MGLFKARFKTLKKKHTILLYWGLITCDYFRELVKLSCGKSINLTKRKPLGYLSHGGDYDSMFLLEMNILCSVRLPPECWRMRNCLAVKYCSSIVLWALAVGWGVSFQIKGLLWRPALPGSIFQLLGKWKKTGRFQFKQSMDVSARIESGIKSSLVSRWGIECGKGMYDLGPWAHLKEAQWYSKPKL